MKNLIAILFLSIFLHCAHLVEAQDPMPSADPVEQTDPSLSQKLKFYGLTGVGLLFLYLSYRQSKWGRKK